LREAYALAKILFNKRRGRHDAFGGIVELGDLILVCDPDALLAITEDALNGVAVQALGHGPVFDLAVAKPSIEAVSAGTDPDGALPIAKDGADAIEGQAVGTIEGLPVALIPIPTCDAGVGLSEDVATRVFGKGKESRACISGE
jgi:hypothetical protein